VPPTDESSPDAAPAPDDAPDSPDSPGADVAEADTPEPVAELRAPQQALLDRIAAFGDAVIESTPVFDDIVVRVKPERWHRCAEVAKTELDCDYLSFVAGIDWSPAPKEGGDEAGSDTSSPVQPSETTFGAAGSAGRFQVLAHVQSTHHHWGITLKTDLDEADPRIESWVSVYPGADWHERECWEMYGFAFDGHPSLRHLYLPSAFEGHPLRKDFPLLARVVKPWPGLVDVEAMPGDATSTPGPENAEATSETAS
jgi:NADH-quinone oxidoreductase subunit C